MKMKKIIYIKYYIYNYGWVQACSLAGACEGKRSGVCKGAGWFARCRFANASVAWVGCMGGLRDGVGMGGSRV
jgi:hypothetical protein